MTKNVRNVIICHHTLKVSFAKRFYTLTANMQHRHIINMFYVVGENFQSYY